MFDTYKPEGLKAYVTKPVTVIAKRIDFDNATDIAKQVGASVEFRHNTGYLSIPQVPDNLDLTFISTGSMLVYFIDDNSYEMMSYTEFNPSFRNINRRECRYESIPRYIEAIKVTRDNAESIARWCRGQISHDGVVYPTKWVNPTAFFGSYLLRLDNGTFIHDTDEVFDDYDEIEVFEGTDEVEQN